ncbi:urease subunit beta [Yersinia frederiksenii]|uniref:urease subunit beta n=1 Tax=Yersinia alsatica TaxID=2890317 RepID=UPI0005DE61D3|nr:urease subunit beta [Yersinia alsatica]OWF74426.1 urease subunit beta [Yersinia frederiksenii]CNI06231.1 urease subunit beta [Yersinia frederiksenii]CNI07988.1 urease subunit beta [Yersinia frederiksenii]
MSAKKGTSTNHTKGINTEGTTEKNTPLGGCILADAPITFNENKPVTKVKVRNTGDRPIQIGSHFHFFEVNRALEFDRTAAFGKRLNISSTTAIRFEPGDETEVSLIPFGGKQTLYGFNNLVDGWTGEGVVPNSERPDKLEAIRRAAARGFKSSSK